MIYDLNMSFVCIDPFKISHSLKKKLYIYINVDEFFLNQIYFKMLIFIYYIINYYIYIYIYIYIKYIKYFNCQLDISSNGLEHKLDIERSWSHTEDRFVKGIDYRYVLQSE